MRRKFNPASIAGSFISWLPLLLITGVIIWLVASGTLGSLGKGIKSLVDGVKDWFQYGGTDQKESLQEQMNEINEGAQQNGIKPSAVSISVAGDIHNVINSYHAFAFSSMLYKDEQRKARDLFINNSYRNMAEIIVAYGERSVPSRLFLWTVLFDDTSGTLRDHVTRFFDGDEQKQFLHYIDYVMSNLLKS